MYMYSNRAKNPLNQINTLAESEEDNTVECGWAAAGSWRLRTEDWELGTGHWRLGAGWQEAKGQHGR